MRQVTIEKIILNNDVFYRAVRRVWTFKAGEIVKFNIEDGVIMAVATVTQNLKCSECVFCYKTKCPVIKANSVQGHCLLCDHHRYEDMNLYFKPIDSVLEDL